MPFFWLAILLFLTIVSLLLKWIIPYISQKLIKTFKPKPDKRAIKALEKLQKLDLAKKEQYVEFYSRVTWIVRRFLEEQFQLKVMAMTTQEFLDQLLLHPIFKKEMQQQLQQFLQRADLVKFAHHLPTSQECHQMQQTARQLIVDCTQ